MSFHDELTAELNGAESTTAVFGIGGGVLRQVLRGLTADGVKIGSLTEFITIATLIIELVQELGPKVAEIIERVKAFLAARK